MAMCNVQCSLPGLLHYPWRILEFQSYQDVEQLIAQCCGSRIRNPLPELHVGGGGGGEPGGRAGHGPRGGAGQEGRQEGQDTGG